MKKLFHILTLSALTLLVSASFVFADIADLPDDPQQVSSRPRIALILGVVLIALIVLKAVLRSRRK